MANPTSNIEWTDATWSPTTGCDRVSAGCTNCYALTLAKRLQAMGKPHYQTDGAPPTSGPGFGVALHPDVLDRPLQWVKPKRIFVDSMSDLFHAEVPDDFIASVFAIMALCRQHTFQILTKRPQRMKRFVDALVAGTHDAAVIAAIEEHFRDEGERVKVRSRDDWMAWPLFNVWLGVSVENQEVAWRIDWLLKTPAAVRFLSCEPLIGPLDLTRWVFCRHQSWSQYGDELAQCYHCGARFDHNALPLAGIDWVITGGESGPHHRPFDPAWAMAIRDRCVATHVPYFHKQNGGRTPKAGGRLLGGIEWSQFPAQGVL